MSAIRCVFVALWAAARPQVNAYFDLTCILLGLFHPFSVNCCCGPSVHLSDGNEKGRLIL